MRVLRRVVVGLLATLGLIVLLVAGAVSLGGWWLVKRVEHVRGMPASMVLVVDLRGGLDDAERQGLTGLRFEHELGFSDVVLALDRAARDPRVKGLVARLDDTAHGLAGAQELRQAVKRFAATGRPTVAFAESFGELGPANEGYYLATAFGRISLQPVGLVGLTGLMAQVPFARPLLDRLGVVADVVKREEYKTALDSATETGLTPANREMLQQILGGLSAQLRDGIAEGRHLDGSRVEQLIDGGPYGAGEARDQGLIDEVAYWDEVLGRATAGSHPVALRDYAAEEPAGPTGTGVAFVRATGPIGRGGGLGAGIAADDLADALSDAVKSPRVRALLLRVDSPGGSAVGSETIARQIRRATAAGKPVIVAMGNAAASGGYWIAMDATRILAQPATLTGSIGVIAAKPVLAGLWQWLGINWVELSQAQNANLWSLNTPFSGTGAVRVNQLMDAIYGDFKEGVARGRKLSPERVEEIAKGRVWLGSEAVGLGLVDGIGGLYEAQAAVRTALHLAADAPLDLQPFPRPRSPFQRAVELLRADAGWLERLGSLAQALMGSVPVGMSPLEIR